MKLDLSKRRALVVIHGVGQQEPLSTLDSLARLLLAELAKSGASPKLTHHFARIGGASRHVLRITLPKQKGCLDLMEYYWAPLMEEAIAAGDVRDWLMHTAMNAIFSSHPVQQDSSIFRRLFLYGSLYLALWILPFLTWLKRFIVYLRPAKGIIESYVGDVAIYTSSDLKPGFSRIRSAVLSGSVDFLAGLLKDKSYAEVCLAGHSLGSVIAYDTLNRLNRRANEGEPGLKKALGKLRALVTFGSPLDKIQYYFRSQITLKEPLRKQITEALHGFRRVPDPRPVAPKLAFPALKDLLPSKLRWLNVYTSRDPISGHLDYYRPVDNRKLAKKHLWGAAHVKYWQDSQFGAWLLQELLKK